MVDHHPSGLTGGLRILLRPAITSTERPFIYFQALRVFSQHILHYFVYAAYRNDGAAGK